MVKKMPYQDPGARFLNPAIILIPTLLDFFASYCFYTALNFMAGSVYQMLRGGTVLTTYLFTIVILKVRPKKHKIVGCIIVLFGLTTVGAVNFIMGDQGESNSMAALGYFLILIGIIGAGFRFIY
jgi:drug/metabolite transporter (DMT)-like permease